MTEIELQTARNRGEEKGIPPDLLKDEDVLFACLHWIPMFDRLMESYKQGRISRDWLYYALTEI